MNQEQQILKKLDKIEKEVHEIKVNMIDPDTIMTEDDYKALEEYKKEKKEGKLTSHEDLKKELGL